jgi:hypothetical protein
MEQLFRGTLTVDRGDIYTANLGKAETAEFMEKAEKYKSLVDKLYSQSVVKNAFIGSEILAFDG